ncbi:MAG TPA: polysaccharide deacetylase family protein [Alphaproteobacteria bacterium]|nr:polysaccharide deacetylase family protein [Alphaproteobacteria bacterium]
MLNGHGRYPYSAIPERPVYDWPGGPRLALFVAINVEVFPFGAGLGVDLAPRQAEPDVVNYSWRDYGNRVGIWNLIDLLDEYRLPATVLLNTEIYDHCPEIAAAFRARAAEFVGHGRNNAERQADMAEAEERALLHASRDIIARHEGRAPEGWMGPWVSETALTPDLVAEAGYRYLLDWSADDQPLWLRTRAGTHLLSIPYSRPTNDLPQLHGAKLAAPAYADLLIDQISEMLQQARRRPLVFNLSLHPYLVGHAFRLRHLRRVFAHIDANREQIWIATAGEIARHVSALPEAAPSAPTQPHR